ncbi:MAG: hypothetical protein FWD79_01205 [Desulfobulbus sp.]|nr:hypothetical protein [Desulfobulbus sp.]
MLIAEDEETMPVLEICKRIVQIVATCIGLAVIVIGLYYAVDVFRLILSMLKSPALLAGPIQELADSFGGRAFEIKLPDRTIPLANLIALVVYCCGALAAAFLTMALMQTGAKIVSLTAGDRIAVKQMLQDAFGRRMRPREQPDDSRGVRRG